MIWSQFCFPCMVSEWKDFVNGCPQCKAANPRKAERLPPTRNDVLGRPWTEVVIDTLELGEEKSGKYTVPLCSSVHGHTHKLCGLKSCSLHRHDTASVASASTSICHCSYALKVVRMDNAWFSIRQCNSQVIVSCNGCARLRRCSLTSWVTRWCWKS